MANIKINEARLRLIRNRQWEDKWGKDYVASLWATPTEAPSVSKATILHPQKLGGRAFHALSSPETSAALLSLYNPNVWEIHEQRILYPTPRVHFLFGHPMAAGEKFSPFKGTLDVCERMGIQSRHPRCRVHTKKDNTLFIAPFPYLGDQLIFLKDKDRVFVVNWSIKDKHEAFKRSAPGQRKPQSKKDDLGSMQRHAMEAMYYQDAEIPTYQIAGEEIDFDLRCNLMELFLSHGKEVNISSKERSDLYRYFQSWVGKNKPANQVVHEAAVHLNAPVEQILTVLKQGVWQRQIRIDLYRPFLMDRRLNPELKNPLEDYSEWFSRG